ncbi:anaerobic ribonucleoside-triphosphate reductase activating protein [Bacillota bacterium LX-D]|nr:anaerobic ribonucleoside-triphosphate reductase activating protein [Bacillota bacterium LX-D]
MIRYADIVSSSVVDGLGIRAVAYLQGCSINCPGCHNPQLQKHDGGSEVTEEEFAALLLSKLTPIHKGITFSGGEPTEQAEALFKVISLLKAKQPNIDIWLFSGHTFEEIKHLPVLKLVDYLVDGPFLLQKRNLNLTFRGSENQRIIDVQKSLVQKEIVELKL